MNISQVFVFAALLLIGGSADETTTVAFLVLAPYGGSDSAERPDLKAGPAVIPAVRLAVDRINNRSDVLPGYQVRLLEGNSGCQNEPTAAYGFVSNIFYDGAVPRTFPHAVGVIGPACSESAQFLGTLGAKDSISLIQISPAATSPLLTDTVRYRNTFRTLSTSLQHIGALAQLMTLNSWENVAVLYDHSRLYFRVTAEHFIQDYSSSIGSYSEIDRANYPLESIVARFKVVVVFSSFQFAKEMICLAYHHHPQLIYPVYQWIHIDNSMAQLVTSFHFVYDGRTYDCSREMMEKAVEGSIFTTYRILDNTARHKSQQTDVDLTLAEYQELYPVYLDTHRKELTESGKEAVYDVDAEDYAVSYYDATWALALALNASLDQISLVNYKHSQPHVTDVIRQHLRQLAFQGLMGRIAFRCTTHDSSAPLNIHQYIGGKDVLFGGYNGTDLEIYTDEAKFVSETFLRRVIGVHTAATTIVTIFVAILTLATFFLHTVFVCFQNHKSIKAASFTMSHFMFSGCYLILLRVFLVAVLHSNGWQTENETESITREIVFGVVCNVSEWLNSIGISLVMGTLCGKLWRIYRLFNHFNTRRYLISDFTLTIFNIVVVGVNVVLLVVWTAVDPLLAVFEQQDIDYDGEGEPVLLVRAYCRCSYFSVWISLTYAVILSLVTCVVVLSLLNRNVNRRYFQTAKSVNVMVYLLALSCFLGIVLAFVFESLDIHYTYFSWQLSLLSVVGLVSTFMFFPPAFRAMKSVCVVCCCKYFKMHLKK